MSGLRARAALLFVLAAAAAPGCAYMKKRAKDLSDIIEPGFSLGSGMGVRANATRLVALEVMAQKDEPFVGWHARTPRWTESSYGLVFASFRMPGLGTEVRPEKRWWDLFTTSRRRTHFPNRELIEDRRHTLFIYSGGSGDRPVRALDLEVGASVIFGGLELTVSPGELLDFFLGWFGLDIGGDDALDSTPITILPGSRAKERAKRDAEEEKAKEKEEAELRRKESSPNP